ncbi:MAG: HD domain-containing protein [Ignavibacteria bacterium]|nr:HD domain-containing protein [Ignavibacteria bacterium]MDP3830955.1 HD domain-containing protein [Ignavibacteriaceae bacterium]
MNNLKQQFKERRDKLFHFSPVVHDSLQFSIDYSLLVEEIIRAAAAAKLYNFALASCGSFSRRELAPYSDIDIMFIVNSFDEVEEDIKNLITRFWDCGIEVSHTIREFNDIQKYLEEDLHTFTQFFETRFILGNHEVYNDWNKTLSKALTPSVKRVLLEAFIEDAEFRYVKYGNSPKVIEPNVKQSAGGLRDLQLIEWLYTLNKQILLNKQSEKTQSEAFVDLLRDENFTSAKECSRLLNSFRYIQMVRCLLHLMYKQKNDRLEFPDQIKITKILGYKKEGYQKFMKEYFEASNVVYRFNRSFLKKIRKVIAGNLPETLAVDIDDDFYLMGDIIYIRNYRKLTMSDILRGFYYRGYHNGHFDEHLRSAIVESLDSIEVQNDSESSVFFRELLCLPHNVGKTISIMNELGVLEVFLTEFADLNGFIQHGVYHCYTADEHTLMTILNVEKLAHDSTQLGKIFNNLNRRDILYLALLFHDIAKPINISGHEIIGAEMAESIMNRLGYNDEEVELVTFLVRNHLLMEQVAFRRNLNDPETLNNFISKFISREQLDLLYLLTYADLSAVNPALWTSWKHDLLDELYRKTASMIEDQISGEELLINSTYIVPKDITKHSNSISEINVQDHIDSINELGYISQFTDEEIARHIEEINSGVPVSVLFKELENFTNITVIAKDSPFLLSKLCGVLSINDANIHDAKIFTRKDGVVIDNFNVTDFRTHKKLPVERYPKIEEDFHGVISGLIQLNTEIKRMKSKWWRIENKFFKRPGLVRIKFEVQEKYTIIDIYSPDRLGFLYQVTGKMNELGLRIYFAKIATKGDEIVDAFYVLDQKKNQVSKNYYSFIETELREAITQIL